MLLSGASLVAVSAGHQTGSISFDHPLNGSVFPPDMESPTFQWHDSAESAASWQIDVQFANGAPEMHLNVKGEHSKIGRIDERCISNTNKLPELTPEEATAHTWKPNEETWATLKKRAGTSGVTLSISGVSFDSSTERVSHGELAISVSKDPVAAPIFYRDVPLMPSDAEKGFIKPLAQSAVPLIEWRMRNIAESKSHIVMTDLHTCANCHSFAANGKTLGLDMDGPQNDKGLYALVPVEKRMTIRNEDMVSWSSFPSENGNPVRVGFMSQVSPDGKYVVTTTRPPGTKSSQFYYVSNFKDYRFLQVFYPTRGIIQWYDRTEKKLRPLPGASDPEYLQSNAVWSPDGQYLVFSRARAKDPNPADGKMADYANDPAEVQIQYDLYRIPFNSGKGGTPQPIEGASQNGKSNSFPKISPDGKWIVFVQAKNGQLMRPDSKLYIVPAQGGKARQMNCNTPLMNSWHSWSPNGRWLVFSSKSRGPYTKMFLTHVDEQGNDTPAILIENSTAANRAVNIPEFVNMDPSGVEKIDTPAVEFYKQYDVAAELAKKGKYADAIPEWTKAIAMSPGDARVHNGFGQTLVNAGNTDSAIAEFRKAVAAKPQYPEAQNNLAIALAGKGNASEAIVHFKLALEANPGYAEAYSNLGHVLAEQGRIPEAIEQYENALQINPNFAEAHSNLGFVLVKTGKLDEGIAEYQRAIESDPNYARAFNNMGMALAMQGKVDEAIGQFKRAVELDPKYANAEGNLGHALLDSNDLSGAVQHLSKAVELAPNSAEYETNLGLALAGQGALDQGLAHFDAALKMSPTYAEAHAYAGTALVMKGDKAGALRHWLAALQQDPDNIHVLNDTAWLLSSAADPSLRNGTQAVKLAERAVDLTRSREPMLLGTLAAAYAEAGDFSKAREAEKKAAELARQQGNAGLAGLLDQREQMFDAGSAIRER